MRKTYKIKSALLFLFAISVFTVLFSENMMKQAQADNVPSLKTGVLTAEFRLDGLLNEAMWDAAEAIQDLTMVAPDEGGAATQRTVIKVLADSKCLVFGIQCFDSNPDGIVSQTVARDSSLSNEDYIKIVLGTFPNSTAGYIFMVNPTGARYDALISSGRSGMNSSWDCIWEAKTRKTSKGWFAEIKIPISSLNFDSKSGYWRMNIERHIQRNMEADRWASPIRNYRITQIIQGGLLTNLPEFDLGLGLSITPGFMGGYNRRFGETGEYSENLSLDVTKKIGSNLLSQLTVNTDFAETEADSERINMTRFDTRYSEKRSFFLEGSDFFEFGLGMKGAAMPFYSRRIGFIEDDDKNNVEVPIKAGVKLNGQIGNTRIGLLTVKTDKAYGLVRMPSGTTVISGETIQLTALENDVVTEETEMAVVRVRQNLGESWIGFIGTAGDPSAENTDGWVAGLDFTYKTSSFWGNKNFQAGIWGQMMNKESEATNTANRSAVGWEAGFPNDLWFIMFNHKRIGEEFHPYLGWIKEEGANLYNYSIRYRPYPDWDLVRKMEYGVTANYYTDLDNNLKSYDATFNFLSWMFESGDSFDFVIRKYGENVLTGPGQKPREVLDITIDGNNYEYTRYGFEIGTAEKRPIRANITCWTGRYFDGNKNTYELDIDWIPLPIISLGVSGEQNSGRIMDTDFSEDIYKGNVQLNFSPELTLFNLTQYRIEKGESIDRSTISTNTRLRWDYSPASTMYLVYNHEWEDGHGKEFEAKIKALYTFRF